MSAEKDELAQRFWPRVAKSDGCWNWTGNVSVYGYGQYQPKRGKNYRAHRLAYELVIGPIPDGLVLDHLCRNRACVNPDHLEPVTSKTNILRGVGVTAQNAKRETCAQGHPFDATTPSGSRYCKTCDNVRTSEWSKAQRQAIVCGAETRGGGRCKLKISAGNQCRNHDVVNATHLVSAS